jgi:hypothetical protein
MLALRYSQGWALAEIALHLSRSTAAVTRLLKPRLKQLRSGLIEEEQFMARGEDDTSSQGVDAIITAYLEAVEAGQALDRQEVLARHPELATELSAFFADHDQVQQLAEPLRGEA